MEMDTEDNEVTLLDLLVAVAENLKLLIFGPVVIGLLALGISYALPQRFTSQAILSLPPSTALPASTASVLESEATSKASALMVSPLVLDPVVEALNLSGGNPIQVASARLAKQVTSTVGKDGLLHLHVTANTSIGAQTIANAVIDTWLKSTVPGGQERADLEKQLDYAKTSLAAVRQWLERISAEGNVGLNRPLTHGEAGNLLVAIGELQEHQLGEVLKIERALKGLTRDVIRQPPTLPTAPVAPKKGVIAIVAALVSGFVLLLSVFMRQAWTNAARDPRAADKLAKLRAALGFKGRPQ